MPTCLIITVFLHSIFPVLHICVAVRAGGGALPYHNLLEMTSPATTTPAIRTAIEFAPVDGNRASIFDSKDLLIASVTVGNVPQMAVDLLISACTTTRLVGRLRCSALLPFVGLDDTGRNLITPAEIFRLSCTDSDEDIYVLQHRSPASRGRAAEYADLLTEWCSAMKFRQVLLLVSTNAAGRRDGQLTYNSSAVSFQQKTRLIFGTHAAKSATIGINAMKYSKFLEGADDNGVWNTETAKDDSIPIFLPLQRPNSFVRRFLDNCNTKHSLPISVLITFAHEGDNSFDAAYFAAVVAHATRIEIKDSNALNGTEKDDARAPEQLMKCFVPPNAWIAMAPPPPGLY